MGEVKEILKVSKGKALPILPTPLTRKGKQNILRLQAEYQMKHGRKITLKSLASMIFESATLPA